MRAHPDDRADLAQEIAAQLWRAFPGYDPQRPFPTWMYRIALNVAISFLRGDARRRRHTVPLDERLHDLVDERSVDAETAAAPARAAALHRRARSDAPRVAAALPRGSQRTRDRRDPRHQRNQRLHQDQPPQAAHPPGPGLSARPATTPFTHTITDMSMETTMELDDLKAGLADARQAPGTTDRTQSPAADGKPRRQGALTPATAVVRADRAARHRRRAHGAVRSLLDHPQRLDGAAGQRPGDACLERAR